MKLGLPWDLYWSTNAHMNSPGIRQVYEERIEQLKEAGAEIYNITASSVPAEFAHSIAFSTLLAVGYGEWLQNWTFPAGDERQGMSSLAEMAAWNVPHNSTTGALGNNTW
ncbi:hypothetical protein LQW54_001880 [Pestalotiopsis sp. IQ-011]